MLWLRHLERGAIPGFAELGREIGDAMGGEPLTGQAISGWVKRDEAPDSYRNNKALASALGVEDRWLIDGEGDPPMPNLWTVWAAARGIPAATPLTLVAEAKPPVYANPTASVIEPVVPPGRKLSDEEIADAVREDEASKRRATGKASARSRGHRGPGHRRA